MGITDCCDMCLDRHKGVPVCDLALLDLRQSMRIPYLFFRESPQCCGNLCTALLSTAEIAILGMSAPTCDAPDG